MSHTPRQEQLLQEFAYFDDPQERLAAIVDRARRRPKLPLEQRTAEHRVPGCTSHVWLIPALRDGRCHFDVGADSPVVLGLVAFVADYHSGSTPAEILADTTDPLATLDLLRTLTPTRRHGLAAVQTAIRTFAQQNL